MSSTTLKPFLKWTGGKTKLLYEIQKEIPEEFTTYHEPFIGGGAVFFDLLNKQKLSGKKAILSDINKNLINCYNVVKNNVVDLIHELNNEEYNNTTENYYANRNLFNENLNSATKQAALFIYLNKTCFNGMYRENKSGKFNVPYGKMKYFKCYDEQLLMDISKAFNEINCEFINCSFEKSLEKVEKYDFVYIDSPYYDTFTDYNKSSFDEKSQEKLANMVENLNCKVLISNSNNDFINGLYNSNKFIKRIISLRYSISCSNISRKKISTELLMKNYN